ncbi:hypothetical protein HNR26_003886 [Rhizobium rosettiformans]|uniref:Uncharacterized protein n=2 Tax=Rhizobium rosettiformans TaxID=1368430 RepID=A0A4S8PPL9_9HYPH|nr:hypothetical protein [Rhizobium rosettiformans]MBB5277797.1 hypothetical protein [Rhizobium rosettiformans]THV32958.1 hypothetical protein FAA86_18885 [Rhizobium rosettiformans W3]
MANVFGSITAFIDKYLIVGLSGACVVLGIAFGVAQYRLSSSQADLKDAETQIEVLTDKVLTRDVQLTLKDTTISRLESRNAERLVEQSTYQFDLKGILDAPAEENQNPVDDVLCRAVSGTKCLQNN